MGTDDDDEEEDGGVGGAVVRGLERDLRGGREGLGFWRDGRKCGCGAFRVLEYVRWGREVVVGGLAVNILSLLSSLSCYGFKRMVFALSLSLSSFLSLLLGV